MGAGGYQQAAVTRPGVPGFGYPQKNNNGGGGGYYGPSSMPQLPSGTQQYAPGAWNNASGGTGAQPPNLQQTMMNIIKQGK